MPIVVRPERIRAFSPQAEATFVLVSNSKILKNVEIEKNGAYRDAIALAYDEFGSFPRMLKEQVPENSHILVVSPECFFESPTPAELGANRKLIALPCNSTPVSLDAVGHFLRALEDADIDGQVALTESFFKNIEETEAIRIVNEECSGDAIFDHLADEYHWNEQVGMVDWGEQQIAPAGELSVMPGDVMEFSPDVSLAINGTLVFRGEPILHSGTPSYSPTVRGRLFDALSATRTSSVIAHVEDGYIQRFEPGQHEARAACELLEDLVAVDSRYRTLWELGFGINRDFQLWPENCGMNEVYGADLGVVHFGLGLTPFTQYALTFLSLGSRIVTAEGNAILGGTARKIFRNKRANCGCHS